MGDLLQLCSVSQPRRVGVAYARHPKYRFEKHAGRQVGPGLAGVGPVAREQRVSGVIVLPRRTYVSHGSWLVQIREGRVALGQAFLQIWVVCF